MYNLDIYKFLDKINRLKIDNKSMEIIKDVILDLSQEKNDDLIINIVNIENVNRSFFKSNGSSQSLKSDCNFCSICRETYKKGEHKTKLCNCNHVFHKKCLNKYMKYNGMNLECPLCKKSYKNLLCDIADSSCEI